MLLWVGKALFWVESSQSRRERNYRVALILSFVVYTHVHTHSLSLSLPPSPSTSLFHSPPPPLLFYPIHLQYSYNVAFVVEVPPVALLPNFVVQNRMLKPFRYHTGGTIMAGKLAKERGWAINIGIRIYII